MRRGEAERVQAGTPANVGSLVEGASCLGECGGCRDESDAAVCGVEVCGSARFAEVASGAGVYEIGVAEVLQVGE